MIPVVPTADQTKFLHDDDPKVARNKRVVFDFFREVIDARHLERMDHYLHENYIQHNPVMPIGREGFRAAMAYGAVRSEVQPLMKTDVVALIGDGDLVTLAVVYRGRASKISFEDYAIALVDELENPRNIRERFTVGY